MLKYILYKKNMIYDFHGSLVPRMQQQQATLIMATDEGIILVFPYCPPLPLLSALTVAAYRCLRF